MHQYARRLIAAVGLVFWTAIPLLAQGEVPANPPMILGLPEEALEHIPGAARLFEVSNASGTPRIVPGRPFLPGEILARFFLDLSDDDVRNIALQAGAHHVVRKSPFGLFVLHGPHTDWAVEQIMDDLAETGKAVLIAPNYIGEGGLTFSPNDPHAANGSQWYLDSPSDIDLDLPDAWDITRGSSGVVIAVMDTGLWPLHPEFLGRIWFNPGEIANNGIDDDGNGYVDDRNGWDTTSPNGDANINDDDGGVGGVGVGHGTWVSSILLANTDNNHQVAGFDHFAKVLPVRSFNTSSGYNLSHVLAGLDYLLATSQHYDLLNMSWVALANEPGLEVSLDALEQAGALTIAGAGNTGGSSEIWYPAAHSIAVTVGGTDDTDTLWPFSDTGTNLDFVAPAVDIYSASFTDPQGSASFRSDDGTSLATPMVTGIASLGLAVRPTMTKEDLVFALKRSAVDLGAPGWDTSYGWGRVNAFEALEVLEALIFYGDFETGDLSRWSSSTP